MAYTHYDRLTALDASFLELESPGVHMHVGAVGIFDPGPIARDDGGIDFDRVLALSEAGLARAPRLRQKLGSVPVTGQPIWVDDPHFNLLYHVRHTALPVPGDERRLKRLAGRIMSEKLDRAKPLWEIWYVEGLEGDRLAVISKIHHCLVDGLSGVDLLSAFMGRDPEHRIEPSDHRWLPRPAPGALQLVGDELSRRIGVPGKALTGAARALRRPAHALEDASHTAVGLLDGVKKSLSPASETPFNVPIGPHRRFDWTCMDLGVVREVKNKLGGSVNDVVLACVAGALRHHLARHELEVDALDIRALVPVSTRTEAQRGKLGNQVSMVAASLPVDEADPGRRYARIIEHTAELKKSGQIEGTQAIESLGDWVGEGLLAAFSRLAASRRSFNLVVTNVPGPPFPIYLNGARMLGSYPLVPLFENQGLGVALFSYDGSLYWGFNADWDVVPDLHDFALAIEAEFEILRKL